MDTATPVEEWRPVEGWPYEVSSLGRLRRSDGFVMSPTKHGHGYLQAWLRDHGRRRKEFVHRLVAKAFLGPPPAEDSHADHINGDRPDNRLENLRWLSPEENRALRRFARGERHGAAKLSLDQVRQIKDPKTTMNNTRLAAVLGVSREQVRDIRNGKYWSHVNG